jgi:hypothetical protein
VACRAVICQRNVVSPLMVVRGQGSESSSTTVKPLPPEHCVEPFGASMLCGSYCRPPQSKLTAPVAQWSARLGGLVIQPWACACGTSALGATTRNAAARAVVARAASIERMCGARVRRAWVCEVLGCGLAVRERFTVVPSVGRTCTGCPASAQWSGGRTGSG